VNVGKKNKPKYTTLTQLVEAIRSGAIDNRYTVVMDKSGYSLHLRYDGNDMDENEAYEHCEQLFQREYDEPLTELFQLLGVKAEWC
jgi:hypothetical protein